MLDLLRGSVAHLECDGARRRIGNERSTRAARVRRVDLDRPSPSGKRSRKPITRDDLKKLLFIAESDLAEFFERNPRHPYKNRVIAVALCQGAALHHVNGQSGIKDFDVYTFFARHPSGLGIPHRRMQKADFGPSKFGRWGREKRAFEGRHVDLLWRDIPFSKQENPVWAIRDWLEAGSYRSTPWWLRQKAVVMLNPMLGSVIWTPDDNANY